MDLIERGVGEWGALLVFGSGPVYSLPMTVLRGVCAISLFSAALCRGQTGTGNIQGTVRDMSGAVVPKAEVGINHRETGRQYSSLTNEVGFSLFPSTQVGQ